MVALVAMFAQNVDCQEKVEVPRQAGQKTEFILLMGFVFLAQVDKLVLVTNNAKVVHKDSLPRIRFRLHSRSFIIIFDNTSEAVK